MEKFCLLKITIEMKTGEASFYNGLVLFHLELTNGKWIVLFHIVLLFQVPERERETKTETEKEKMMLEAMSIVFFESVNNVFSLFFNMRRYIKYKRKVLFFHRTNVMVIRMKKII